MTTQDLLKIFEEKHSKKELSIKSGVSLQNFYDWENGSEMKWKTAFQIANSIGVDLSNVIKKFRAIRDSKPN